MAPKSVTFRRHDHLVSVLFGDLLSHSYNITLSMFLDLVCTAADTISFHQSRHTIFKEVAIHKEINMVNLVDLQQFSTLSRFTW